MLVCDIGLAVAGFLVRYSILFRKEPSNRCHRLTSQSLVWSAVVNDGNRWDQCCVLKARGNWIMFTVGLILASMSRKLHWVTVKCKCVTASQKLMVNTYSVCISAFLSHGYLFNWSQSDPSRRCVEQGGLGLARTEWPLIQLASLVSWYDFPEVNCAIKLPVSLRVYEIWGCPSKTALTKTRSLLIKVHEWHVIFNTQF